MLTELSLHTVNKWDDDALQMLYSNFYKALVVYASSIMGSGENAEDIVQDTFMKMWQKRPSFESEGQLKMYLYTTTHNMAVSYLRKTVKEGEKVSLPNGAEVLLMADNGEENVFGPEIYRHLLMMVEKLPPRQREVFLMAMEGKKNNEIAEQLEISLNTVKVLKGRALQTLKQKVDAKSLLLCYLLVMMEN